LSGSASLRCITNGVGQQRGDHGFGHSTRCTGDQRSASDDALGPRVHQGVRFDDRKFDILVVVNSRGLEAVTLPHLRTLVFRLSQGSVMFERHSVFARAPSPFASSNSRRKDQPNSSNGVRLKVSIGENPKLFCMRTGASLTPTPCEYPVESVDISYSGLSETAIDVETTVAVVST
jgi:hypothetical protein